jgi:hypothetical protein
MRIGVAVLLSVATLLVFEAGPWVAMGALHGNLLKFVVARDAPYVLALLFGPSVLMQIGLAIYLAVRR